MWISPINGKKLFKKSNQWTDGKNIFKTYSNNLVNLLHPTKLNKRDLTTSNFYDNRSDDYDKYLHLTFETYGENENQLRKYMIDKLGLKRNSKILEVGCGTGRDSLIIGNKLGKDGYGLFIDISEKMIAKTIHKIRNYNFNKFFALANATNIPIPNKSVDCVFSFGGVGEFSSISHFLKECIRVTKVGGKVVIGDENLPIWLRDTQFGKILSNYNKQFLSKVPFKYIPIEARNVKCEWIIGGVFYLIEFEVGEGEPYANFSFEIPGKRGGTHLTRMYGQLEGVSQTTKELAYKAQEKSGLSMHLWLDRLVKREAKKILSDD